MTLSMVHLALSPRAAEALKDAITESRANMGAEFASGDEEVIATAQLLEQIRDELTAQLNTLAVRGEHTTQAPATRVAQRVAEQMAAAGASALRPGKDS